MSTEQKMSTDQKVKDNECRITIDLCTSFIMELIGIMSDSVDVIKKNLLIIINKIYNSDKNIELIINSMKENLINIETLTIFNLTYYNDGHKGKLYRDLYGYSYIDNGIYYIKNKKHIANPSKFLNYEILKIYKNSLISLKVNHGVHWLYIDEHANIHNSYNYNMQIDGSHQFCQSYALLMAISPITRQKHNNIEKEEEEKEEEKEEKEEKLQRKNAYELILSFLQIIFPFIIYKSLSVKYKSFSVLHKKSKKNITLTNTTLEDIIYDVKKLNLRIEEQQYHDFINNFDIVNIPTNSGIVTNYIDFAKSISNNIILIMQSDIAKQLVPEFY